MTRKLTKTEKAEFFGDTMTLRKRFFVDCEVAYRDNGDIAIAKKIKLWAYLLAFIPSCIIELVYVLWNGGLSEFVFLEREIFTDYYSYLDYDRIKNPVVRKLLEESKKWFDNQNKA